MECFTIWQDSVKPGIHGTVDDAGREVIRLGETGRGRKQVDVPLPRGSLVLQPDQSLLLEELPSGSVSEDVICVRLPDMSGYRGSWTLQEMQGVRIIAEGRCAQGEAGHMGGGPDVLVTIDPGGSAVICRGGRLYGTLSTIGLVNRDGVPVTTDLVAESESAAAADRLKEVTR